MKPEERVRQSLIAHMKDSLGYPSSLIVVERALALLPHLKGRDVPNRRLDLMCLEKGSMRPLLLIECKAERLNESAVDQVFGYNYFVGACCVGLVSKGEAAFFWKGEEGYKKMEGVPTYQELCVRAKS
ncbi:MAG: hypothetical protein SP1CHLAM54_01470 [Chlamydiia bacterium]|nr:hypothetical protein [Chlamydiia bacterium]MCH9615066.1 hypothetical protein [Chlamydiia bacterium]MCH9628612.1 hypothetical protein [Chlamydiia bacterium]